MSTPPQAADGSAGEPLTAVELTKRFNAPNGLSHAMARWSRTRRSRTPLHKPERNWPTGSWSTAAVRASAPLDYPPEWYRRRCAKPCTAGGCCPSRRVHRRGHRALDAFPVSGAALASPGGGPFPADIPAAGSGGHTRHRGGLRLDDALGPELDRASLVALPTPVCQVDGDRILAEVLTVDHSGNVALAAEAAELTAIGCSSGHLRPGAWSS